MTEPIEWIEYTASDIPDVPVSEWNHYTIERNVFMTEPEVVHMDLWDCLAAIWRRWTGKK